MRSTRVSRTVRLFLIASMFALLVPATAVSGGPPVRSIVLFEDGAMNAKAVQRLTQLGGAQMNELPMVNGVAVVLPSKAAERAVARLEGVAAVEPDIVCSISAKPGATVRESVPWGVDKTNADLVWPTNTAGAVRVAVLDTGVDYLHPDLAPNVVAGTSTVGYTGSFVDDNGHGTHVSGVIAAAKNSSGIVGMAPAADLYVAKVMDSAGNGYLSDIVEGIEWAVSNDVDVINMSLGTSYYSSTFDYAVQQALAAGVVVVAAAGNEGPGTDTVSYPAKFNGVIGVSAVDAQMRLAYFSSRGPAVDVAAPGVKINSTYPGGGYATMSGTSMAAPHVAGAVALVLASPVGADDADLDLVWDPSEVEARLERTARDLGVAGFDPLFGNGFLRADVAALQ